MFTLIRTELYKIARRPRSYIGFAAILLIVAIIEFALYIDGASYIDFIFQQLEGFLSIEGKVLNGYLVCFIILQTLIIQMPLLVALITGDLISGEAANGTLRLLLTRPVSRSELVFAKFTAGSFYVLILLLLLGVLSLGGSLLLFGEGDLIILKSETINVLKASDVLWRFYGAFVIAFLSLSVVSSFSLMLSCFTDNSIGPIIITMAVIVIFTIIGSFDLPLFDYIKPFLFTSYMIVWRNMFDQPIDWGLMGTSIAILVFHIILFLSISLYYFNQKDIHS
ncbi:MAG: ABC transporter permease subunit [Saprospiraceae bacterium]|nr:ABC transporter permease subunit [Candidatus Vicinibacter affinis]